MKKLNKIISCMIVFLSCFQGFGQCLVPTVSDYYNSCVSPGTPVSLRASTLDPSCTQTISHRWYTSETGSNYVSGTVEYAGACSVYQTRVDVFTTTSYWVSAVINGCESSRVKATGWVFDSDPPAPKLHLEPAFMNDGSTFSGAVACSSGGLASVILEASGGHTGNIPPITSIYEWYDSPTDGNLLATGPSYSTTINMNTTVSGVKTFYVGGTLKNILGCSFPISPRKAISIKLVEYPACNNSVETYSTNEGTFTDYSTVIAENSSKVIKNTTYLDGLGRPIQNVIRQGSPARRDIVEPVTYDGIGRQFRKYLPVTLPETDGSYKPGILDQSGYYSGAALNFYNNSNDKIADDQNPFADVLLEDNPLNRIHRRGSPGAVWQPALAASSYPNNSQSWDFRDFQTVPQNGGGGVSASIQNKTLIVTFSAGFSSTTLKTGQIKFITSTPVLFDMDLGPIAMNNYRAFIKDGYLSIESTTPTPVSVSGFGTTSYGATKTFTVDLNPSKCIKSEYLLSNTNEVLRWTYDPLSNLIEAGTASAPIYYSANSLFINKTIDEADRNVLEYVNNEGRTILKRVQTGTLNTPIDDAKYASTYYIYNDFGSLVCVIPPEATSRLSAEYFHSGATATTKESFLNLWAFRYKYDSKKRMSEKKIPGADWVYLVYDNRNRLVLTQDGNQRAQYLWTYTKYDALNRPIITGIYNHGSNVLQSSMSDLVSTTAFYETFDVNLYPSTHGYSNNLFPNSSIDVLTVIYYDNYNFKTLWGTGTTYDFVPELNFYYVTTLGSITGTKAKVLDGGSSSNYIKAIKYYDEKHRLTQEIADVYLGGIITGVDRTSILNDFTDKTTKTKTTHRVSTVDEKIITRTMEYDHAGRLLRTWHQVGEQTAILLSENEYNEIGQLVGKDLHSSDYSSAGSIETDIERTAYNSSETDVVASHSITLGPGFIVPLGAEFRAHIGTCRQSVDYRYNIRGWLTSINNSSLTNDGSTNDDAGDLFGMNLLYEQADAALANTVQYNGNISAMKWSANLGLATEKERAYKFDYDPMNRLQAATHLSKKPTWLSSTSYHEDGFVYDLNGNIKNLNRKGANGTNMDILGYTYSGNQLLNVGDAGDKSNGFIEPASTTGDDYIYDSNGNMYVDQNKGIMDITYNHLNLPVRVTKNTNEYIKYIYDAAGRKLRQEVYGAGGGAPQKTTDYAGEFIYEGGTLQFINHDEGRIIPSGNEYQYHLKDHLGNVRLTFTTKEDIHSPTATMETANATDEQAEFLYYNEAVKINHPIWDKTNAGDTYYATRLTGGSTNEIYGLAKSLSVMPGDKISIEVYAKYLAPDVPLENLGEPLRTLITQLANGTAVPGTFVDGGSPGSLGASSYSFDPIDHSEETGTPPKAYLNYMVFDNAMNSVLNFGFARVTAAARETGTDVFHERLFIDDIQITEPGYVYIYLSNENETPVEVYFDDFKVKHVKSPVVQMDDYYPFGLTFNSASRENSVAQSYKYGSMEEQTELSLGWSDYGARMYMPEIGRWGIMDKYSAGFARYSPYNYAINSPIVFTDPDGNYPVNIVNADGVLTRSFMHLVNIVLGISYNTLIDTRVRFDRDVWYHPHQTLTHYSSGGITIHHDIILTNDYDTRGGSLHQTRLDVEKWLGLIPHELGHRVQRERSLLYLTPYILQSGWAMAKSGSIDANIIHDKIPMEVEAEKYQQDFLGFFNFFNYKDEDGNDRNKITDLFSGGRKDDDYIISQLNSMKQQYDQAKDEEAKKRQQGFDVLMQDFSSIPSGTTFKWNGSAWVPGGGGGSSGGGGSTTHY